MTQINSSQNSINTIQGQNMRSSQVFSSTNPLISQGPLFQNSQNQILFQSFMKKEGGSVKSWKKRFFELTRTHLHYYRSTTGNTRAELLNSIEISSLTSLRSYNGLYRGYDFVIVLETEKRTFWFSCESAYEQSQWLKYIRMVMEGYFLEESKPQELERIDLKVSQQMEIARCAIEVIRRAQSGIQSPHEEAYFESLKYFYKDLKKWISNNTSDTNQETILNDQNGISQEKYNDRIGELSSNNTDNFNIKKDTNSGISKKFTWDYATATCLLVIPEEELDEEEKEWVKKLNIEYDRYQSRIKSYNDKTRCRLDSKEQDAIFDRAKAIFMKPSHERTEDEKKYLSDLKDTYWKLYRLEKENGLKINHTRLSEVLTLFSQHSI